MNSIEYAELQNEIKALQFEMAAQKQIQVDMIHSLKQCAEAIYEIHQHLEDIIDYYIEQD